MNRAGLVLRAGAVLAATSLLAPVGPVQAAAAKTVRADSVLMTVDSMSPSTPEPTQTPARLTVNLTLTNKSTADLADITVVGERGEPIGNQAALDTLLADPAPPTSSGLPIPAHPPVTIDALPAGTSTSVTFVTTTSTLDDHKGICICATPTQPLIYPLFFSAHTLADGVDNRLGVTVTYLPVFYQKPQPVRVSWVWPLLERPHRFLDETVFTDDDLAGSVELSGRLDRALAVVEGIGARIPLTLLIDPELLDELEVMASEPYTVESDDGVKTPGTGQQAASAWLDRLRAVLVSDPDVTVKLTPYGDPDVEAVTHSGIPALNWSSMMPATMADRVSNALAGRALDSTLAWPATGAIDQATFHRLCADGVRTLVLKASAVTPATPRGAVQSGLGRLLFRGTDVIAALTSPAIEKYAAGAVSEGGPGAGAIPALVAELAVRAAQQPDVAHSVTLTAPRYVDPDVTAAIRTMSETSQSTFATPTSLTEAVKLQEGLVPTGYRRLAKVPAAVTANPPTPLQAASVEAPELKVIRSVLDTASDDNAAALVQQLPGALQRAESAAWRDPDTTAPAANYAGLLTDEFGRLEKGVHIVEPTSSYTLASDTSPLPISVANDLPYAVHVSITASTLLGQPGFSAKGEFDKSIDANQTRTFQLQAKTDYPGLIKIVVQLRTPNGRTPLGDPVTMRVRSTALGRIGVIITVVAGVVLALALLWRVVRRLRQRRASRQPPSDPRPVPAPEPVR